MLPREYLYVSKRGHVQLGEGGPLCGRTFADSSLRDEAAGSEWYKSRYKEFLVSGGSCQRNEQYTTYNKSCASVLVLNVSYSDKWCCCRLN